MLLWWNAFSDRNTRDHSAWTPYTGCVSHTGYFAHGNSNGEIRGRNRFENNSRRVIKSIEENNGSAIRGESPKQDLTRAPRDTRLPLP